MKSNYFKIIIILIFLTSCHRNPPILLDLRGFDRFNHDTIFVGPNKDFPKTCLDVDIVEFYPYKLKKIRNINWANIFICHVQDTNDTIILIDCGHEVSPYVYKKDFDWFMVDLRNGNSCPSPIYVDLPKINKVKPRFKYYCGIPRAVLD